MNPYCSGFPIDPIPPVEPLDTDLPHQIQVYQIIVGCINWISTCTHPDIAPALVFLYSYRNAPHPQHYKTIVHALKYPTSTNEYEIYYHSKSASKLKSFNHFPHHHDKEASTEATYPRLSECHQLTVFCDDCLGGQFGGALKEGTPLELFKFNSLSGFLI